MKISEKLLKRLKEELNLDIQRNAYIKRTYAGYWQKSQGAFLWYVYNSDGIVSNIGSCYRISDLLKSDKLEISTSWEDIEIFPKEKEKNNCKEL